MTVAQVVKRFLAFIGPYPVHTLQSNSLRSSRTPSSCLQVFRQSTCIHFSPLSRVLHAPPTSEEECDEGGLAVRLRVSMAASMKMTAFWSMAPCSPALIALKIYGGVTHQCLVQTKSDWPRRSPVLVLST
jgi:hypothetical protein